MRDVKQLYSETQGTAAPNGISQRLIARILPVATQKYLKVDNPELVR